MTRERQSIFDTNVTIFDVIAPAPLALLLMAADNGARRPSRGKSTG
jgi:hypothetical protein